MANNQYVNKVEYDGVILIDLTEDTVTANDMLATKTAHDKSGAPITGNIVNNGSTGITVSGSTSALIPAGYYNGSGSVTVSDSNLSSQNIRNGVTILGVTGNYQGGVDSLSVKLISRSFTADDVIYPEDFSSRGITQIGDYAFAGCRPYAVSMPSTITELGVYSLYDSYIGKVVLSHNITTIAGGAFSNARLPNLPFPSSLTSLSGSFSGNNFESLIIPSTFDGIGTGLVAWCSSLRLIDIPSTILALDNYPFTGCINLKTIICRASTPPYADSTTFSDILTQSRLSNITIYVPASSVSAYEADQYWGYYTGHILPIPTYSELHFNLTSELSVSLYFTQSSANAVTVDWGDNSATETSANTSAKISHTYASSGSYTIKLTCAPGQTWSPGGIEGDVDYSIIGGFKDAETKSVITRDDCDSIILRDGCSSLRLWSFAGCTGITSMILPRSVTTIPAHCFDACTSLVYVDMSGDVATVGDCAFTDCSSLISFNFTTALTSLESATHTTEDIDPSTFAGCTALTYFIVPEGVVKLPNYCFNACTSLSKVILHDAITNLGFGTFSHCTGLTDIVIPENITSIGSDLFDGCTGLTDIVIPNNVTVIESLAFSGCSGLISITLGSSVTELQSSAFSGCSSLESITSLNPVPPSLNATTFENTPNSAILYVPSESISAYTNSDWAYFTDIRPIT